MRDTYITARKDADKDVSLPISFSISKNIFSVPRLPALCLALTILTCSTAYCSEAFSDDSSGVPATVTGKLETGDRDEEGNVTAVVIFDDDDEEYMVANDEKGAEIARLIDKTVRVTGTVTENEEGVKVIKVIDYEETGQ